MKELFIALIKELRRELDNKTIVVRINYIKYEFTKDDRSYQLAVDGNVCYYYSTWYDKLALDNLPDIDIFMISVNDVCLNVGHDLVDGFGMTESKLDSKYNVVYKKTSKHTGAEEFKLYVRDNKVEELYQTYTVYNVNDLINVMSNHCIGLGVFSKRYKYITIIKFRESCQILKHNMPSPNLQDYINELDKSYS